MISIRILRRENFNSISTSVAAAPSIYVSNPVSVNFDAVLLDAHIVLLIGPASVPKID